jgi:hypothetical protein
MSSTAASSPGTPDEESIANRRTRREVRPTQKIIDMEEHMGTASASSYARSVRINQGPVPKPSSSKTRAGCNGPVRSSKESHKATEPSESEDDLPIIFNPKILIYPWQHPLPKDFAALSPGQKKWKAKIDEYEKVQPAALDDADDWRYQLSSASAREVASNFVARAKSAFWKGTSWDDYVTQELKSYSEAKMQEEGEDDCLSQDLKTDVWDSMKKRLCEEIWLERYRDPPGLVKLRISNDVGEKDDSKRVDSGDPGSSTGGAAGRAGIYRSHRHLRGAQPRFTDNRRQLDPRPGQVSEKIIGRTLGPDGYTQPFYEGEASAPHGIAKDMAEMRRAQQQHVQQEVRGGGDAIAGYSTMLVETIPGTGHSSFSHHIVRQWPNRVEPRHRWPLETAVRAEVFDQPLNMETSDEGEA